MYYKLSKYYFFKDRVRYLGYVVILNRVEIELERVEAVQKWPTPESISDIRVFIRFVNYYRRFIDKFSKIAAPLNRIIEGIRPGGKVQRREEARKITLTPEVLASFIRLRRAFIEAPFLRHFDLKRPSRVETNASGYALSGILA